MPKKNPLYKGKAQFERYSGRPAVRDDEPGRKPFRKDYARLLHAPAFRRLQGKTQLFPGAESDFFRNRLTHSLEVAQIAKGIAARLNATEVGRHFPGGEIDEDLVEFAAIAHDLGHPPFGHNGEYALDEIMRPYGGFEGNAQTLRILAAVERKLVPGDPPQSKFGLDLTYRSLAAVLKYDQRIKPVRRPSAKLEKGYYASEADLVQQIKSRVAPGLDPGAPFKTIECAIMDIADDIAYSTYDLEDSLHAGFVSPLRLADALINNSVVQRSVVEKTNRALKESHFEEVTVRELLSVIVDGFGVALPGADGLTSGASRKKISEADVVRFKVETWMNDRQYVDSSLARSQLTSERVGKLIAAVELVPNEKFPQLSGVRMRRPELLQVEVLKHLNYELVIRSPRLAVVEHRGKEIVQKIFHTLAESDGSLLPLDWQQRHAEAASQSVSEANRVICDYVACMTDSYAAELFGRLFGEGSSIFKPL